MLPALDVPCVHEQRVMYVSVVDCACVGHITSHPCCLQLCYFELLVIVSEMCFN